MGKSNLLKDSMKGGLNGLLSSTTPLLQRIKLQKLRQKRKKRQQYTATFLSTKVFIPE